MADALGAICHGTEPAGLALAAARAALFGPVATNRGERVYYAQIDTLALDNVDTAEGIWSTGRDAIERRPGGEPLFDLSEDADVIAHRVLPLTALSDPRRWTRLFLRWDLDPDPQTLAEWRAARRRLAVPLLRFARRRR